MSTFYIPLILEIALALVISWALFSVLCSMIHEFIVQIKAERGRFTKKMIWVQLMDSPNNINWGALLYMNSRIDLLSRAYNKPVSEINSKTFAQALIESVANSNAVQTIKAENKNIQPYYNNETLNNFKIAVNYLAPSSVIALLQQFLKKAEIMSTVSETKEAEIYNVLVAEVEQWYNEFGERLTIWYRKKTRGRVYFLAFIISAILNVDSIQLFKYYNNTPDARKVMINYYEKNLSESKNVNVTALTVANEKQVLHSLDSLQHAAKLPIGWDDGGGLICNNSVKDCLLSFLLKLLGFAISAFAAGMGAPFWFEILKKVYTTKNVKS